MTDDVSASNEASEPQHQGLHDLADPLDLWARIVALGLGSAALGFGCYAVMRSENQAGTALVLIVGAVLLVLGLQGTPLRRLGGGEHSVELAALRRQRGIELIAEAVNEQPPQVAAAVAEAVASLESPRYPLPRRIVKGRYAEIQEAIERVGGRVSMLSLDDPRRHGYDMVAIFPSGYVNVDVHLGDEPETRERIDKANASLAGAMERSPGQPGGFVLVSRGPLSAEVQEYNRQFSTHRDKFEVVAWDGFQDDGALARALLRNARDT